MSDVVQISCGYEHSAARTSENKLFTWGHGSGGLLGHGDLETQPKPKLVKYFDRKGLEVTKI